MKRIAAVACATALLSGCAHNHYAENYTPVVDTQGVNPAKYQQDLADCRKYAEDHDPAKQAVVGALAGALIGAALGAAVGSSFGNAGYGAKIGTIQGAAGGTVGGAANGVIAVQTIVRNCLAGRGYNVLY